LALLAALACGGPGSGEPPLSISMGLPGPKQGPPALESGPRELDGTTVPALSARRLSLEVPEAPYALALELATGVSPGEKAAFRLTRAGDPEPLFFVVMEGGENGRWVHRLIDLPGAGSYRLELLPAGAWDRRLGAEAPDGAAFGPPRLVPAEPGAGEDDRPNLLLVSADTLRADRLGCYGSERPTSPAIDGLAREGLLVERAYAASNWTLPSHYSLFTGLDPSAHGVNPDMGAVAGYLRPAELLPVRGTGREVTLAETLRGRGYRTWAFTESGWVSPRFGFDQGFDAYHAKPSGLESTRENALAWLRHNAERGPWFLFVHTYEVHQPYHAPPPYDTLFVPPGHVGFALPGTPVPIAELNRFRNAFFPASPGDVEAIRGLYDGEVAYLDGLVEGLRRVLEEAGVERRTVLVFTSDHGEELLERGALDHVHSLYEEVARVPLVIWAPGRLGLPPATRLEGGPASLLDLAPTLAGLLGVDGEGAARQGRDLSSLLLGEGEWAGGARRLPAGEPVFAESLGRGGEPVRAVWLEREGRLYKYLRRDAAEGRVERLFDLSADPGEVDDLSSSRGALLEEMRALDAARREAADELRQSLGAGGAVEVDEETREILRSLGYLR
jgi:arylsulfatase A-like enzyme